jgi:purine-binding chemotaxis protein CheW
VPVLDARPRFRLPPKAASHTDHLILASAGPRLVALRIDRVLTLAHIDARDVEHPAAAVPDAAYVSGVAMLADGLVVIHDLRTFLYEAEADALATAMVAAAPGGGR